MKFWRKSFPTIMSGEVVRFKIQDPRADDPNFSEIAPKDLFGKPNLSHPRYDGEINASRDGVSINGHWPIISDPKDVQLVADTLNEALREVEAIKIRNGYR